MMIAIISDVHGNYPALKAVLKEIDRLGCQQIISLGDVSGYYCMVNECIDEFRKRNIVNLLGNHDYYILGKADCPRSRTVNMITEYQRKIITPENMEYLSQCPIEYDTELFSARHGGWKDPIDEYISEFEYNDVIGFSQQLFCSGHTHIQHVERNNKVTYFNPGSVGQPRDYDCRAAYAIINDDESVEFFRVEYDISFIAAKMSEAGFDERTYECLFRGTRIGG